MVSYSVKCRYKKRY